MSRGSSPVVWSTFLVSFISWRNVGIQWAHIWTDSGCELRPCVLPSELLRVGLVVLYSILPIHSTFCYTAPQTEVFNICDIHTIMCTSLSFFFFFFTGVKLINFLIPLLVILFLFILIIGLVLCCKRWVFLVISPCAIHDITWRRSRGNSQQVSEENLATVTAGKSVGISNNSVQSQYRGSRFSDVPVLKLANGAGKLFCVFHLCTPVGGW